MKSGGFHGGEKGDRPVFPALKQRGRSGIKHRAQGAAQHSISVTAGSIGPAAPGVVQWCNKIRSSSTLCSGRAPNQPRIECRVQAEPLSLGEERGFSTVVEIWERRAAVQAPPSVGGVW